MFKGKTNFLSLSLYFPVSFLSLIHTNTHTHTHTPQHPPIPVFGGLLADDHMEQNFTENNLRAFLLSLPLLLILGAPIWPFSLSAPGAPWLSSLSPLSISLCFRLSLLNVYLYGSCNPKVQPNHQAPIRLKVLPFSIHTFTCWLDTPHGHSEPDTILNMGGYSNQSREFQKNIYFCFMDNAKPLTIWITINCGKFWDGHTRPPDLPLEKPAFRSGNNS